MAYRRTTSKRRGSRSDGSFWLSFSDLMSSLVLIIILVMFYIIYQYFNLAEINQAEIARRQLELDQTQAALESRETELATTQAALETQKTKLNDTEKQMIAQQILLTAKEEELQSAQDILAQQEEALAATQTELEEKETQIAAAQSQLDTLSTQLADKQSEIDTQETQLAQQQTQLTRQQEQLDEKETQIAAAQTLLTSQQSQLDEKEAQIASAQALLASQQAQLENQQVQIEQLVGMKTRIISSLSEAFRKANISATVDPANGSIALESDVLFDTGKFDLTSGGQHFFDQVLPVYLEVLLSEEYKPYLAEIIIEGHTDSDGSWIDNLKLSQQRALAVADYALGTKCKSLSNDIKDELRRLITVNGRSYSDRIFRADGTEDKDASRRVVFKFRLTDEQMIQQLQAILEKQ